MTTSTPTRKNQKAIDEIRSAADQRKQDIETNYLKPNDVAAATGLCSRTILRRIHSKRLVARNEGTRAHPDYRIHKDDVMKLLEGTKKLAAGKSKGVGKTMGKSHS